jgi:hypothetical protein
VALKDKYVVRLTADDRRELERMVRSGRHPTQTLVHARILLKADTEGSPGWGDAADSVRPGVRGGKATAAVIVQGQTSPGNGDEAAIVIRPTGGQETACLARPRGDNQNGITQPTREVSP